MSTNNHRHKADEKMTTFPVKLRPSRIAALRALKEPKNISVAWRLRDAVDEYLEKRGVKFE